MGAVTMCWDLECVRQGGVWEPESVPRLAGRDLKYLLGSYAVNAAVVLSLLATCRNYNIGVVGVWGCLLTFQVPLCPPPQVQEGDMPPCVRLLLQQCSMSWNFFLSLFG